MTTSATQTATTELDRSAVIEVGRSGRRWEFLPLVTAMLRLTPHDTELRFLAAANFAALGLRTPALDMLDTLPDAAAAMPNVVELAQAINGLPSDALDNPIDVCRANVDTLKQRGVDLAQEFETWSRRARDQLWVMARDGNVIRRPKTARAGPWIGLGDHVALATAFRLRARRRVRRSLSTSMGRGGARSPVDLSRAPEADALDRPGLAPADHRVAGRSVGAARRSCAGRSAHGHQRHKSQLLCRPRRGRTVPPHAVASLRLNNPRSLHGAAQPRLETSTTGSGDAAGGGSGPAIRGTARDTFSIGRHADAVERLLQQVIADPPRSWPAGRPCAFNGRQPNGATGSVPADGAACLKAVLEGLAGRRVVIHGTGQHTLQLADVLAKAPARIVAFTDDDPQRYGKKMWNWPIIAPSVAASMGATDVVISSWINQRAIWDRRGIYQEQGLTVHQLYDGKDAA